jgi:hypothetical protein
MVNYGQNKEYQVFIESVDYYPEIAGVKVSNFPVIAVFSIVPLWFDRFGLSVITLFALIGLFYRAGRLEDEGNPMFLNATLIRLSKRVPLRLRIQLLPSFAHIKTHIEKFRR